MIFKCDECGKKVIVTEIVEVVYCECGTSYLFELIKNPICLPKKDTKK